MSRTGRLILTLSRYALCALVVSAAGLLPAPAAAQEEEPPINITADKMEYFSDRDLVVFTGNAVAVRSDTTISSDSMEVTLSGDSKEREESSIEKVVAIGGVNVRQSLPEPGKDRFATGERGEYDARTKIITLEGKPRAWEGQNVITGKIMKFFIDENRFVVESDSEIPVGMTVYPEKGEEEKK